MRRLIGANPTLTSFSQSPAHLYCSPFNVLLSPAQRQGLVASWPDTKPKDLPPSLLSPRMTPNDKLWGASRSAAQRPTRASCYTYICLRSFLICSLSSAAFALASSPSSWSCAMFRLAKSWSLFMVIVTKSDIIFPDASNKAEYMPLI